MDRDLRGRRPAVAAVSVAAALTVWGSWQAAEDPAGGAAAPDVVSAGPEAVAGAPASPAESGEPRAGLASGAVTISRGGLVPSGQRPAAGAPDAEGGPGAVGEPGPGVTAAPGEHPAPREPDLLAIEPLIEEPTPQVAPSSEEPSSPSRPSR